MEVLRSRTHVSNDRELALLFMARDIGDWGRTREVKRSQSTATTRIYIHMNVPFSVVTSLYPILRWCATRVSRVSVACTEKEKKNERKIDTDEGRCIFSSNCSFSISHLHFTREHASAM